VGLEDQAQICYCASSVSDWPYLTDFGAPVVDKDQTRLTMSEKHYRGISRMELSLSLESTWLTGASCDSTSFFQSDHSNGGNQSATIKKKRPDGTTNEKE
jgi:hypothetical protein